MNTGLERLALIILALIITAVWIGFQNFGGDDPIATEPEQVISGPKSIMYYPQCSDEEGAENSCSLREPMQCFVNDQYRMYLDELRNEHRLDLVAKGTMQNGDKLEIYTQDDNRFLTFVIGPDQAGMTESCLVAEGKDLSWVGNR